MFRINIQKKNFENTPEFTEVSEQLSEQTTKRHEEYLMKLRENLNSRFSDLFSFKVQPWIIDSFCCDIESVDENLQGERIELKCNDECKYKFERGRLAELWLSIQQNIYFQNCGLKWLKYCYTFQLLIWLNVASVQSIKF